MMILLNLTSTANKKASKFKKGENYEICMCKTI